MPGVRRAAHVGNPAAGDGRIIVPFHHEQPHAVDIGFVNDGHFFAAANWPRPSHDASPNSNAALTLRASTEKFSRQHAATTPSNR